MYNIIKFNSGDNATMKIRTKNLLLLTITLALLAGVTAFDNSRAEANPSLAEVDSKYVCMVTNKLFPNVQIPVEVADKTYYGCCEMCKAQLANNPEKKLDQKNQSCVI